MEKKEQTFKQILESKAYEINKEIVRKDINQLKQRSSSSGMPYALDRNAAPAQLYIIDYNVFKKTDLEKGMLFKLKSELKEPNKKLKTIFKGSF